MMGLVRQWPELNYIYEMTLDLKTAAVFWIFFIFRYRLGLGIGRPAASTAIVLWLFCCGLLRSAVWTRSVVCSFVANPLNARFHSKLFKATAHTRLRNFDLLSVRVRKGGESRYIEDIVISIQFLYRENIVTFSLEKKMHSAASKAQDFRNSMQTFKRGTPKHNFLDATKNVKC